jgi:hypothetical protein
MPFHMEAVLWGALGELRSAFGVHLAGLGALYKVDLPERLGEMLPASDDDQGAEGA